MNSPTADRILKPYGSEPAPKNDGSEEKDGSESRFEKACRHIKNIDRLLKKSEVDEFFKDYKTVINQHSTKDAANLLHTVVNAVKHNYVRPKNVEGLTRRLVKEFPDLLIHANYDKCNPIVMAIAQSEHELAKYMVTACAEMTESPLHQQSLSKALNMKTRDGNPCLHLAIYSQLEAETLKILIQHASDDALAMKDKYGKTPMHLAMDIGFCTEDGAELIKVFLGRDLRMMRADKQAPKTFLDAIDNNHESVYLQLHNQTRSRTIEYNDLLKNRSDDSVKTKQSDDSARKASQASENSNVDIGDMVGDVENWFQDGNLEMNSAPPKPVSPTELADKYSRSDEDKPIDKYNKERVTKKTESLTEPTTAATSDDISERGTESQETSQDLSTALKGQDIANTVASETISNTSLKQKGTDHAKVDSGKEKEKPANMSTERENYLLEHMPTLSKYSTIVLSYLKVYYMRTRNTERAMSFLYGANAEDVHVSFDYDNLPRELSWNQFTKRFGQKPKDDHLSFDNVLQYVTIPSVQVVVEGRKEEQAQKAAEEAGTSQIGALGRKDTKYFLDWLVAKGVRHIINLSVEDSGHHAERVHGDQIIQQSLERLIIEQLDWQKMDLDPETILRVGCKIDLQDGLYSTPGETQQDVQPVSQHLRELSLRWSGSNVALRAWSEPEGLVLLPKLKKITLIRPPLTKEYDTPQWIAENVRQFQNRLNANRKVIRDQMAVASNGWGILDGVAFGDVEVTTVHEDNEQNKSNFNRKNSTSAPTTGDVNPHRWLKSASTFAGHMSPFWKRVIEDFLKSRVGLDAAEKLIDDILIVLIDDGVDMCDPSLSDTTFETKSFDYHNGTPRPGYSSAHGHGTAMATMIQGMCPMAKILSIRLKTYLNADGTRTIDGEYAAKAVETALNRKPAIISMSWTLPMPREKDGSVSPLHKVLQKAVDDDVLMFCSAPDDGKFTELDYPSGPWRDHFFRIGAAGADGTIFKWTPDDITYVLPGVKVAINHRLPENRVTKLVGDVQYETGSSIATALAAGLAAMIIYCIKASILIIKTTNQNSGPTIGIAIGDKDANLIAKREAMNRAFSRLGTVTKAKFIQVWEKLDVMSAALKELEDKELQPGERLNYLGKFVEFGRELAGAINAK